MKQKININNWSREKTFQIFNNFDDPYTGVTTRLNITNLVEFVKNTNVSFYGTMLYFVLMSLNEIEHFKYGYGRDEQDNLNIYKYDEVAATATFLNKIGELNFTRYIKFTNDYIKFIKEFYGAKSDAENNVEYYKIPNQDNMNKIQVTCLPWIRFSNFKDSINKAEKSSKPKICWGEYYKINNEYFIDFSLLVNHAFQDGIHIAMLINGLQSNISNINLKFQSKELQNVKKKSKNKF